MMLKVLHPGAGNCIDDRFAPTGRPVAEVPPRRRPARRVPTPGMRTWSDAARVTASSQRAAAADADERSE
jgi:hypothetical protein